MEEQPQFSQQESDASAEVGFDIDDELVWVSMKYSVGCMKEFSSLYQLQCMSN
jgi:hypothetical protein